MEDYKDAEARKNAKTTHPFLTANIVSRTFFTWTFPLFVRGFKRDLLEEDLYPHLHSHDSTYLGDKLEKQWLLELMKNPENPSLWKCIAKVFRNQFLLLGSINFIAEYCLRLGQPFFLAKLLEYYGSRSAMTKYEAYYYAAAIATCSLLNQVLRHTFTLHNFHLGMKIRVATTALVYRKALKLSKSALAETTVGQMVNLISNDVGRFESFTINLHNLWMAPIANVIVLVFMYLISGLPALAGVLVILMIGPLQMWLGKKASMYRLSTALRTDERIRLMNEVISGMQVIKMYTWERPFAKLVEIARRREMEQIKKGSIIRSIMMSFTIFVFRTITYVCVLAQVLSGKDLTAQYVYVVQSLYGILRTTVDMSLPQGITQMAEANISVRRITTFLLHDEVNFDSSARFYNALQSSENSEPYIPKLDGPIGINIKNASFKWIKSRNENTLENMNIEVRSGQLVAIIGSVGSGKSTLLHVMLGELIPMCGSVKVNGRISFASQEPWLFVGSVRQNIIFGQTFDAKRYHEVVRVCQLKRDFTLFPHGDRTIVGERGVSLSGGQRARINLARAVYKQADIYLLDDPLSAVDAHVGKQMFKECITGYLKEKSVVLVTHQLQYLKSVQQIYLLRCGKIDHSGNYDEIQNAGSKFTQLLNDLRDIIDEDDDGDEEGVKLIRRISYKETIPRNEETEPKLEQESKQVGSISWSTYKSYFLSGGHWSKIFLLLIIFIISQGLGSIADYFVTIWVNMPTNEVTKGNNNTQRPSDLPETNVLLIFYSIIIFSMITLTIIRSLAFYRFCIKASIRLHNNMFYNIVYATMRFFNTNPSGRILNRFSMDINRVDEVLPTTLLDTIQMSLYVIAIIVVIACVSPWMLLPAVIMLTIFYFLRVVFLATSRDIKRSEGITRSPVYSHLTASLQGLTTIRAFGAQEVLKKEFDNYMNAHSSAYFMFLAVNRTFGFWLDMHCVVFITLVTMSFLVLDTDSMGGDVGLAITQSFNLCGMFQWGMRQWSELENSMTCVERIKEYTDVTPEQNLNTEELPELWPQEGKIVFDKLSLRYAQDEPTVLKELTFSVNSSEKIGIVGRTGAGKSSIIVALFRLAINEGKILIDNVDTSRVSFSRLRSSISIIPQEPVLFSGTMRKNLDPFDEYTDEVLWRALEDVELKSVSVLTDGLESRISEGGSNFSVGQRQLVCLARAIIRKNKILVLDEATANIDPHTDALIQSTIRKKFLGCTVLTIAHRLHTIMDSDKVLVMDAGKVIEFDNPYVLLQNKTNGVFYKLVEQTGRAMAENLRSRAQQSYQKTKRKLKLKKKL